MPLFGKKNYSTVKVRKRDMPDGLWDKCPGCSEIVYSKALQENARVCSHCQHHFRMPRAERLALLSEPGSFVEWDARLKSVDALGFVGVDSYPAKLEKSIKKTGQLDAITTGRALLGPHAVGLGVMDFEFLGASMGSVVGEKVTRLIERSTQEGLPVIISCTSGGARMYEGMLSLMQMAKTSAALARHAKAGLPYIPILTDPTTAGVMASYATLGDVIIAEPGALIGFAGARVIKETTQQNLPPGFQRSEFLLKHGLLDMVIHRRELKATLIRLLDFMSAARGRPAAPATA